MEGQKTNNVLVIISLILSLVGLIVSGIPCGIAAVVTGIIGIVKYNPETKKGKGMAIVGIVVGVIDIIMAIMWTVIKVSEM